MCFYPYELQDVFFTFYIIINIMYLWKRLMSDEKVIIPLKFEQKLSYLLRQNQELQPIDLLKAGKTPYKKFVA